MNVVITVLLIVAALAAGVLLAFAPVVGVVLGLMSVLVIAWTTMGRAMQLVSVTLVFTILGLFSGLLNPALVGPEMRSYAATLKWLPLVLPIVGALAFSARTRELVLRPGNWAARLFLVFIMWSGVVLVMRAGLDPELLFKWGSVLMIYFYGFGVVPGLVTEQHDGRPLLRAFALVAGVIAAASLVTLVLSTGDALSMGRLTGIAFNALTLAMFLTLGVLAFATLGFNARGGLNAVMYFAAAAVCAGLLILTGGRASVIALFLGLATLLLGMFSERRMRVAFAIPAALGGGALLLLIAIQLFGIRLDQGLFREKGGEGTRLELIRDAGSLLAQDPLTLAVGTGFGVVRKTYYARLGIGQDTDLTATYRDTFPKLLHNSYLEILVETGVVGLVLLLCSIGMGLKRMRSVIRTLPPGTRILGYGCLGIVVAAAVESAFNSVLLAPGGALSIWLWSIIGVYASWDGARMAPVRERSYAFAAAAAS